jgi:signal transduction histidine kinase
MKKTHSERSSYVRIAHATLPKPGSDVRADGRKLITHCLAQLDGQEDAADFPPKLLVLMATVPFQPFDELLAGIHEVLDARKRQDECRPEVRLIGGSVAGVIDGNQIHTEGVQLVCIASRLMDVQLGTACNVLDDQQRPASVKSLCEGLGLTAADSNVNGNRFLFCFLPGFRKEAGGTRYKAAEIEAEIRTTTGSRFPMFGGVTGDDFCREAFWQFADRQVLTEDAVVALVDCDVRFGIGMSHGLDGTGDFVFARELTEDGQGVKLFERHIGDQIAAVTPEALLAEYGQEKLPILFGGVAPDTDVGRVVLYPRMNPDGSVSLNRPVIKNWPLEILRGNPDKLCGTVADAAQKANERGLIDDFHLAAAFVFPCTARYQHAPDVNALTTVALDEYAQHHPDVPLIGALVFGEIGLGENGRSQLRNWNVSTMLLSDEIAPRSFKRRANEAIAEAARVMMNATDHEEVIEAALEAVHRVGLPGAMFSNVYGYKFSFVILAHSAIGEGWTRIVPLTNRKEGDQDILIEIARRAQDPTCLPWEFVRHARRDERNDRKAVDVGKIVSYYVSALTDSARSVIGLLQVGLGDMSNRESLPDYIETFLTALSGHVSTALSQLIRKDEAELSDLIDRAVAASLTKTTVAEAAQTFVCTITQKPPLRGCMIHVRLARPDPESLTLVAGIGEYYELAKTTSRRQVRVRDKGENSPTVRAFVNRNVKWWVNQTTTDDSSCRFLEQLGNSHPSLQDVLRSEQSYVNLPIQRMNNSKPLGVIHIASKEPWFFSESLYRSLRKLGRRLYFVLTHVNDVEQVRRRTAELEFLRKTTPPLQAQDLSSALQDHAKQIAEAAQAEVVSFFLWDSERGAFVLRGQHGWNKDVIGDAHYLPDEGMTGTVAADHDPIHIPDLSIWKRERGQHPGKYESEMFGSEVDKMAGFEVIAIPIEFNGPLGILTLHNRHFANPQGTRFATTDLNLLHSVADDIAAFVFATQAHQEADNRARQEARLRTLQDSYFVPPATKEQRLRRTSQHVCANHRIEGCAIYLVDESQSCLIRGASHGFDEDSVPKTIAMTSTVGSVFENAERIVQGKSIPPEMNHVAVAFEAALPSRRLRSFLVLPLEDFFVPGRKGVLVAANIRNRDDSEYPWFTKSDVAEIERVSRYVTRAIHNSNAAEKQLRDARELKLQERQMAYNAVVLATLTHDLRNRIGAILSEIRTITDQTTDSKAKERSERAEEICETLAKRVSQGLEAVGNSQLPDYEDVSLQEIVQSAIGRCEDKARKQLIEVELNSESDFMVRGAAFLLDEAFTNLIDNALNALDGRANKTLRVDIRHPESNAHVTVSIQDSGRGIPEADIPMIRDGFYRSTDDARRASGFSLARYVFRQHGGEIEISSCHGKGTTVVVSLPRSTTLS